MICIIIILFMNYSQAYLNFRDNLKLAFKKDDA